MALCYNNSITQGQPTRAPSLALLLGALGVAQLISWGTLFYTIGVLGPAMREELGASSLFLFSSFTGGLLLSGFVSPFVGAQIDKRGGRFVLSVGSMLAAAAMGLLAVSTDPFVMAAGWLLAGAAMAACLYDPAFATLSQHVASRYRQSVSALTVFGGFASTVFWPLSQLGLEALGWRQTFAAYALLHLLLCLPLHLFAVPRERERSEARGESSVDRPPQPPTRRGTLSWLAASLALGTFVFTVLAVHMIGLLTDAGLTAKEAVTVAMLFGPVQVAGRVLDMTLARHIKGVTTGVASFALMVLALAALMMVDGFGAAAFVFVIAYGIGNGTLTIVRGTVAAEIFGREGLGARLGRLSRATLLARALAPGAFSALLTFGLARNEALSILVGLSVLAAGCYFAAIRTPVAKSD